MEKNENKILDVYFLTTSKSYTVREEQYNGKDYLVAPVVMMVEGVHSGSHGPILHLAEELGRYPESWNGMPITIGHPMVEDEYVPANSPQVLVDWATGIVFNTRIEDSLLKAEAWIEKEKIMNLSLETYERLMAGEEIEVSVGIYSDKIEEKGEFNGELYDAVAINYRPEHLALLPAEVGACSIKDGCGIRVNTKGGVSVSKEKEKTEEDVDKNSEKRVKRKRIGNNEKNVKEMAKEQECTDCVKKLVDSLIANKATAFTEDDRETLESLDEAMLEKMTPQPEKIQANTKPEKVTREQILEVLSKSPLGLDEYLKTAPKEVAEQIRSGIQLNKQRRATMIKQITANTDVWTKEELEAEETEKLEKLFKVAVNTSKEEEDGVLRIGNFSVNSEEDEDEDDILLPMGYEVKKETK